MRKNASKVRLGQDYPLSIVGIRQTWKQCPVTLDCDGMGSIPAIPKTWNMPLLLCHELFNEASLPAWAWKWARRVYTGMGGQCHWHDASAVNCDGKGYCDTCVGNHCNVCNGGVYAIQCMEMCIGGGSWGCMGRDPGLHIDFFTCTDWDYTYIVQHQLVGHGLACRLTWLLPFEK